VKAATAKLKAAKQARDMLTPNSAQSSTGNWLQHVEWQNKPCIVDASVD
jgi:hypothetical protein